MDIRNSIGLSIAIFAQVNIQGFVIREPFPVQMHTQQDLSELLRLSMDLTQQAYFIKAKNVLAAYSQQPSARKEEVYSQVAHMRWRMGLPSLKPSEVERWLHPSLKATQQDASEIEWMQIPAEVPKAVVEGRAQHDSWSVTGKGHCVMVLICVAFAFGLIFLTCKNHRVRRLQRSAVLRRILSSLERFGTLLKQAVSIFKPSLRISGATIRACCALAQIKESAIEDVVSAHLTCCTIRPDKVLLDASLVSEDEGNPVSSVSPCIDVKCLGSLQHAQAEELVHEMPDASEVRMEGHEEHQQVALETFICEEMSTGIEELTTTEGSEASFYSDAHSEGLHDKRAIFSRTKRKITMSETTFVETVDRQSLAMEAIGIRVRELAWEAFGCNDELMHLKKSERIAALLLDGKAVAYATYVVRRDLRSFGIGKLAVARTLRQQGLGRILLRHLTSLAKKRSRGEVPLDVISLSALASSVQFYRSFGFREETSVHLRTSEDVIEGQVYMEYRLHQRRGR